jgi:hypothetical protein
MLLMGKARKINSCLAGFLALAALLPLLGLKRHPAAQ